MRLGDLDALSAFVGDLRSTLHKEQSTFKAMTQSEFEIKDSMLLSFQYAIDNAPTVELNDKSLEIAQKSIELGRNVGKLEDKLERQKGEWVPVSERLPEQANKSYLVTLEYKEHGKGVTTLWYHGKEIGWDLRVADVVTAWQPLPEPYKKGGAE